MGNSKRKFLAVPGDLIKINKTPWYDYGFWPSAFFERDKQICLVLTVKERCESGSGQTMTDLTLFGGEKIIEISIPNKIWSIAIKTVYYAR